MTLQVLHVSSLSYSQKSTLNRILVQLLLFKEENNTLPKITPKDITPKDIAPKVTLFILGLKNNKKKAFGKKKIVKHLFSLFFKPKIKIVILGIIIPKKIQTLILFKQFPTLNNVQTLLVCTVPAQKQVLLSNVQCLRKI